MAAIKNILNTYAKADSAKKVDIIIRNYPNFLGIVDGYTEGLRNIINENKNADYLLWNGNRVQIKRVKFEKYVDALEAI